MAPTRGKGFQLPVADESESERDAEIKAVWSPERAKVVESFEALSSDDPITAPVPAVGLPGPRRSGRESDGYADVFPERGPSQPGRFIRTAQAGSPSSAQERGSKEPAQDWGAPKEKGGDRQAAKPGRLKLRRRPREP
ncbi:MAG TPA: hypothetical protein VHT30_12010 [Acidimicrobiales bacterium]|jgi:hypothetical protein|nr:hypothetical protein [Acidimicrobiales bacterium]